MSRGPSARALAVVTLLAAALLAVGATLAIRPAVLLGAIPELAALLAALDPGTAVLALLLVLVLVAPTIGIAGRLGSGSPAPLVDSADESDPASRLDESDDFPLVGESFQRDVALATAYEDRSRATRAEARERLVDSLRPIAATTYANRAGLSLEDATAAVETGAWTDDPRAAAFLGGEGGPSTPIWLWLIDLVSTADPFARSLERTVAEIERLQSTPTVAAEASAETAADASANADAEVAS